MLSTLKHYPRIKEAREIYLSAGSQWLHLFVFWLISFWNLHEVHKFSEDAGLSPAERRQNVDLNGGLSHITLVILLLSVGSLFRAIYNRLRSVKLGEDALPFEFMLRTICALATLIYSLYIPIMTLVLAAIYCLNCGPLPSRMLFVNAVFSIDMLFFGYLNSAGHRNELDDYELQSGWRRYDYGKRYWKLLTSGR